MIALFQFGFWAYLRSQKPKLVEMGDNFIEIRENFI